MAFQRINKTITGDSPGKETQLNYLRIGTENINKKVFLQAALHADEQPGIMVLHHLISLLKAADEQGLLNAQFVLFPMVNPIGMSDISFHQHQGRYDRVSGVNFNRQWPKLFDAIKQEIGAELNDDAVNNTAVVRQAIKRWLDNNAPVSALQQQRDFVMREAYDADYVLDLHCDNDALLHLFSVPQLNEVMQDLSDYIGASAILTAEDSGGGSFDEVWPSVWLKLAKAYPDSPFTLPAAATLEYRGNFDTFDALGEEDAKRLFGFFQAQGLIKGTPVMPKPSHSAASTALAHTEMLRTDCAGLLAYQVELGEIVKKGQIIAEVIMLDGDAAFVERRPIIAGTDGLVLSRNTAKYVWPGCSIAKIVGNQPLETRGAYLLED